MTSYTAIADTEIDAESPVTEELMTRMRDNPIAITEGATGAPRNQLASLPELVAGDSIRGIAANAVTSSTAYVDAATYIFLQRGTVRATLEHLTNDLAWDSDARLVRIRAGVETVLVTWSTSSTTAVARTQDVTVSVGDILAFRHRSGSGTAQSTIQNMRIRTDGGDLWPPLGGLNFQVTGNSV